MPFFSSVDRFIADAKLLIAYNEVQKDPTRKNNHPISENASPTRKNLFSICENSYSTHTPQFQPKKTNENAHFYLPLATLPQMLRKLTLYLAYVGVQLHPTRKNNHPINENASPTRKNPFSICENSFSTRTPENLIKVIIFICSWPF